MPDPDRWTRVESLFHDALDVAPPERAAWVRAQVMDDPAVADDVMALLQAHETSHPLLDAPAVTNLPRGMRVGPYALERILGAGGMATVYLAHRADRQFEKHVAVKLVNQGFAAEIAGDRFQTERHILARLEHPNIARLLDAGVSEYGQPYLVMELVEGVPLDTWVRSSQPTLDRRLALWLNLASAVAYAHRNLVVHRDLKPSNVLVTGDGLAKLVDFGIAKLVGGQTGNDAATRTVHFTPAYASPEQLEGEPVTTATDVYGLGILLFELVTGEHPFRRPGLSAHDQTRVVLESEARVPAGTPPDLAAIIGMALRRAPERRYASVDLFAEDVRRFRSGRPVAAQPESVAYHVRRFVARHRLAVSLAAAVTLALVGLTAVALRQARVATEQRARAEEVTDYIMGFLGATPTGTDWALRDKGAGLRVVELADLIAARLAASAGMQRETEATLRHVLGTVYLQTGQLAAGEQNARRARELFAEIASPDDPRLLSALLLESAGDNFAGRFADAERKLLDVKRRWANPPMSAVSIMSEQLGLAEWRLGKLDEAERTFLAGLSTLQQARGTHDRNIGLLRTDLSLVYIERGQFDRAARELEQAVAIARTNSHGASLTLAWSLVNLANTYRFLGRYDDVLPVATEALARMKEALGTPHFSLVHPLVFIAYAKALRGDPDAEDIAREAVAMQATLPPDHYERAVGLTFLGVTLSMKGKTLEARSMLERALELRRKHFTAPNWRIAETAGFLGVVCARLGDRSRALALLQESVAMFEVLYGHDNPRTAEARKRLDGARGETP